MLALTKPDLPQLGISLPPTVMMRFLVMVAHYHGQTWNAAKPARSLRISETMVRRHVDLLAGTYLLRVLPPWHANIGKRQVKAPKLYWRDSGLLHQLLGIASADDLFSNPRCGASWKGFVLESLDNALMPDEAYFWATHTGAKLDAFFIRDGRRLGIEIKRAYALGDRIQVLPLGQATGVTQLAGEEIEARGVARADPYGMPEDSQCAFSRSIPMPPAMLLSNAGLP